MTTNKRENLTGPSPHQYKEGDIQWITHPDDVTPEQEAAAKAHEAAERKEGLKLILEEKLAAKAKGKGNR